MNIELSSGKIIIDNQKNRYRILSIIRSYTILCLLDTKSLHISSYVTTDLMRNIINGIYTLTEDKHDHKIIDINKCPEYIKSKYFKYISIMQKVRDLYGPSYLELSNRKPKEEISALIQNEHISKVLFWKITRRYLQSGFDALSVIDQRLIQDNYPQEKNYKYSRGRKKQINIKNEAGEIIEKQKIHCFLITPEIQQVFDTEIKYAFQAKLPSLTALWDHMNSMYFSESIVKDGVAKYQLLPENQRPSLNQFRRYFINHTTIQQRKIAKTSAMEFRNNCRILKSDTRDGVMGPGAICEVDEVEYDCYIVDSETKSQNIGKPIVYVMIDRYTRQIIAISVSLENNSTIGITNCFLNLSDNKVEYCNKYGVSILQNEWESYIPQTIVSDQGSEYIATEFKRICNENNINPQLAPPGTGSLKPLVEQSFHQSMSRTLPDLYKRGAYSGDYTKNAKKSACLTINDFTKLMINFVLEHNATYMKSFRRTKQERIHNVKPIPNEIYKSGCEIFGQPRKIVNLPQFYYSVMKAEKAVITRRGILFKELVFYDDTNEDLKQKIFNAETKRIPIEIRFDPRDVYAVFYKDGDGTLRKVELNHNLTGNDFDGMTLQEYLIYLDKKHQMEHDGNILNDALRAGRHLANINVIGSINPETYTNIKGIDEARNKAKQKENNSNSIRKRIESVSSDNVDKAEKASPIKQISDNDNLSFQELNKMMNARKFYGRNIKNE